jgi:hypothetical protein
MNIRQGRIRGLKVARRQYGADAKILEGREGKYVGQAQPYDQG